MIRPLSMLAALAALAGSSAAAQAQRPARAGSYLFAWVGDSAMRASDFLAVIDADPASPTYARVVTTLPVGVAGMPHHTEHTLAPSEHLLASDFGVGRTFLLDVHDPLHPRVLTSFGARGGFSHPHSYFRLPDGNVIATFQYAGDVGAVGMAGMPMPVAQQSASRRRTGGLVVMTERGRVLRSGSAATPLDSALYPYSVLALGSADRALSTTTNMDEADSVDMGARLQLWRLHDLRLLRTFDLPPGPHGTEQHFAGEARLLNDGHTIYVHTFECGLYRLDARALDTATPELVHTFEGHDCGVPVVAGHYWIEGVPAARALVALDVADPAHPREVSRVVFDSAEAPHWIAIDPTGTRIVVASPYHGRRMYVVNFDPKTGMLAVDQRFRDAGSDAPGIVLEGRTWPQGYIARALPHGTVFSRR